MLFLHLALRCPGDLLGALLLVDGESRDIRFWGNRPAILFMLLDRAGYRYTPSRAGGDERPCLFSLRHCGYECTSNGSASGKRSATPANEHTRVSTVGFARLAINLTRNAKHKVSLKS